MKLPNDIKAVGMAAIPITAALILFVLVGSFGISKISDLRTQISQAQSDQNALSQKLSILQAITTTAANLSTSAVLAIPDSNTSLAVFAQLKNLAALNSIVVTDMKAGGELPDNSGLSRVDVSFGASGKFDQIAAFLKGIPGLAPIMGVKSIKISESSGVTTANITVSSYWAELPKTIPPSTQSVSDLTTDEKSILSNISSLTPPNVSNIGGEAAPAGRPNPFQ